jgi:hypothetical protein
MNEWHLFDHRDEMLFNSLSLPRKKEGKGNSSEKIK